MNLHAIEFIGGPLDGHTHLFKYATDRLPEITRLEISPDVLRVLTGETKKALDRPTSTAIYCRNRDDRRLCYFHLASITAQKHPFDNA